MPRNKPQPLVQLDPDVALERLKDGERIWVDLIQTATFFGVPPEAFLSALQSGELVASRKPERRGKGWSSFLLASDTVLAWAARRSLEPVVASATQVVH